MTSHRPAAVLALVLFLTLLAAAAVYFLPWPAAIGPAQPVAFSHRVHAGVKQISCIFCHPGVIDGPHATVPPVAKCMLCHQKIIPKHPEIVKIRQAYERDTPIAWVKANDVPEFVYFTHERHIREGIDCGRCHGNVTAMDRLAAATELNMGFCIPCHRDNKASVDCYVCHR
ncbi:MAG: cytochrome c family protein [Phycisphaerae bacterium]|nr:cytochrome c family protein [Phycisphaerae bacterium]